MKHSFKDQILYELKSATYGYPDFVLKNSTRTGTPVFVYHTIEPDLFESHLKYLQENGYRTLSIEEFLQQFKDNKSGSGKSVLLTIDDARSSVWRYAYPLLKKYQMKATIFMIPGLTKNARFNRLNLEDVWEGTNKEEEIYNIDPTDKTLCTWGEISSIYSSGLIDIELHTLYHREIFCGPGIKGFVTQLDSVLAYNFSGSSYFPFFKENIYNKENYTGLPLFESRALMLPGPFLKVSPEFISECKKIYNNRNGSDSWKNEIINLTARKNTNYLTVEVSSIDEIKSDLTEAREIIQGKLGCNAGNHLCLPWTLGNNVTVEILKELGIKSCLWGTIPGENKVQLNQDEFYISRIKNDFIFRLPGDKRRSLVSIYNQKLLRRLRGKRVF